MLACTVVLQLKPHSVAAVPQIIETDLIPLLRTKQGFQVDRRASMARGAPCCERGPQPRGSSWFREMLRGEKRLAGREAASQQADRHAQVAQHAPPARGPRAQATQYASAAATYQKAPDQTPQEVWAEARVSPGHSGKEHAMAESSAIWTLHLVSQLSHIQERIDEDVLGTVRALGGVTSVDIAPSYDASSRLAFATHYAPAVAAHNTTKGWWQGKVRLVHAPACRTPTALQRDDGTPGAEMTSLFSPPTFFATIVLGIFRQVLLQGIYGVGRPDGLGGSHRRRADTPWHTLYITRRTHGCVVQ